MDLLAGETSLLLQYRGVQWLLSARIFLPPIISCAQFLLESLSAGVDATIKATSVLRDQQSALYLQHPISFDKE